MVSILVPCRNEASFIQACIESILFSDYPADRMELLVLDGMSTDGTRENVRTAERNDPRIRLLDNPKRVVGPAMNLGIQAAKGEVILRVDGHATVPVDFVRKNVEVLEEHPEAWCVGGAIETVSEHYTGKVIAAAMTSPVGVGNARFRLGDYEGPVDTVAFGAYRKWVFDKIGFFDEELVRNQDDELNMRILKAGGTIWMSRRIRSTYYSRTGPLKLWRQYFQYGFWRVRTLMKHRRPATIRQILPMLFVIGLLVLLAAAVMWPSTTILLAGFLCLYAVGLLLGAMGVGRRLGWKVAALVPAVFAILHFAYGFGGLWGGIRFVFLRGAWMKKAGEIKSTR